MNSPISSPDSPNNSFQTTHWSIVLAAGRVGKEKCHNALATLCQAYWYPLYSYVRRREPNVQKSQDLTQEFFLRLLDKNVLASAAPERGRFRAFLLASIKNFLANERDREAAMKRGGHWRGWSLDWEGAESRLSLHPAHELTPDRLFERAWAIELLERVLERLRKEFDAAGKARQFDVLKDFLTANRETMPYASIASDLGVSEAAARQAAHRLRKRYRELLRDEVAQTVADPAEVDDEIRGLFENLGS